MKKLILPILTVCLFTLFSCHKDHVSGPIPINDTLRLNLISSEAGYSNLTQFNVELIVSEPGGKVLLDTITPGNTHISVALATNASTVDLTNIYATGVSSKLITITTYRGVNPANWAGDYNLSDQFPMGPWPAALLPDTLNYTNLPTVTYTLFSQNQFMPPGGYGEPSSPTALTEEYPMLPGNYAYLLCSTLGLYKMIIPSQTNQTIDCSTMDTAATATFTPSSYYSYYSSTVNGYSDSNNLNTLLQLYFNEAILNNGLPQLEYPTKNIQNYAVRGDFFHGTQEEAETYSVGPGINPNIVFPDPNAYSLGATQNNQFSVAWNAAEPTYYKTFWLDSTINWTIYASPDSAAFNPIALLTAQKSKMLQGQDLTLLKLNYFQYGAVPGYDYAAYLGLVCDSTQLWKHPISGLVNYYKFF